MVSRFDIRIEISDSVDLDAPADTAAWVYIPDSEIDPHDSTVLFAFPGGTYSRAYYDLHVPGRADYSFAEHLAKAGHIVIACDHVGIGDSSSYRPFAALTEDVVISADRATVKGVMDRLADGSLVDGLEPIENPFTIGAGHSMGGTFLILQQAWYRTFDALAVLGWSQISPPKWRVLSRALARHAKRERMPDPTRPPRQIFHRGFHDEKVPKDVIATDDEFATRIYSFWLEKKDRPLRTMRDLRNAGRDIDCPVFLGFGTRDVSPDPHRESAYYPNSSDITTFVLPNSAHCFNFAEDRRLFFDRIAGWAHAVSKVYRDNR